MPIDKESIIRLKAFHPSLFLDGLEPRAPAWRNTAAYLTTGEAPAEEYNDAEEARKLAEHYERTFALLLEQQTQQDRS